MFTNNIIIIIIYECLKHPIPYFLVRSEEVVVSAAWLHDVLDKKMITSDKEYKEKDYEIRSLLANLFTSQEALLIMDITENISYSTEVKTPEFEEPNLRRHSLSFITLSTNPTDL